MESANLLYSTRHQDTAPTALPPLGIAQHLPPGGLIAIAWSSIVLAGMFVAARTVIRITRTERLDWDDYWIYIAYTLMIVSVILQTLQTPSLYYIVRAFSGLVPLDEEYMEEGNLYARYEFVIMGLFWTVLWSVKASFLALYWRLFQGLGQYKKWWKGVAVFTFLTYLGCWMMSLNVCHPPALYFKFGGYNLPRSFPIQTDDNLALGKCLASSDRRRSWISVIYSTVADIVTDLMSKYLSTGICSQYQLS